MADIFLSYSRADRDRVEQLVPLFERQGWSVWWDPHIRAGTKYHDAIDEALGEAKCVVVVWTKSSVRSDWVMDEAREGMTRQVLVPIVMDDIQPPLGLRSIQAVILTEWQGQADDPRLRSLFEAVKGLVGSQGKRPPKPRQTSAQVGNSNSVPPTSADRQPRKRPPKPRQTSAQVGNSNSVPPTSADRQPQRPEEILREMLSPEQQSGPLWRNPRWRARLPLDVLVAIVAALGSVMVWELFFAGVEWMLDFPIRQGEAWNWLLLTVAVSSFIGALWPRIQRPLDK